MAHYAFIDENNVVVKVIYGIDETLTQEENGEVVGGSTEKWEQFYEQQSWHDGAICKRTSYNANFRGKFAAIGDVWTGENFEEQDVSTD